MNKRFINKHIDKNRKQFEWWLTQFQWKQRNSLHHQQDASHPGPLTWNWCVINNYKFRERRLNRIARLQHPDMMKRLKKLPDTTSHAWMMTRIEGAIWPMTTAQSSPVHHLHHPSHGDGGKMVQLVHQEECSCHRASRRLALLSALCHRISLIK